MPERKRGKHPMVLRQDHAHHDVATSPPNFTRPCLMNILVILLILLLLGGGGYGFSSGNHYVGGGASLIVIILLVLLFTGRI